MLRFLFKKKVRGWSWFKSLKLVIMCSSLPSVYVSSDHATAIEGYQAKQVQEVKRTATYNARVHEVIVKPCVLPHPAPLTFGMYM